MGIFENSFCCVGIQTKGASAGGALSLLLAFVPGVLWKQDSVSGKPKQQFQKRGELSVGQSQGMWAKGTDELMYNKLLFNLLSSCLFPLRFVSILQIVIFLICFLR